MAESRPYGNFGPVCDFTGEISPISQAIVIDQTPKEQEFQDAPEFGTMVSNPSWMFAPTVIGFQKKGNEFKAVLDYDWENDPDNADVLELWKKWDKVEVDNWFIPQAPPVPDLATFCEEPYDTTNLADEVRDNETYKFTPRSSPMTMSVNHPTWDEEMNEYAAWTSAGICSFEGKTIAIGNAKYWTSNITVPTTGTYTLRYRFSKQGEVWLNKFETTGTQQLLNLTETRVSYNNSAFQQKSVTLTAGTYKITIYVENPTVTTFQKNWADSPAAAALQIYQGNYSATTVSGIPTVIGMIPLNSDEMVTWTGGAWTNDFALGYENLVGVITSAESGTTATIPLSHTKGLTGTITVQKETVLSFDTTTNQTVTSFYMNWALTNVTAYGSGYAIDERINVTYTGSTSGTTTAQVKIFDVESSSTSTGILIWSTKDNSIGFDTTIITN